VSTSELAAMVKAAAGTSVVLLLHESATEPLTAARVSDAESLMLIIGPEGGITDDELAVLTGSGATAVRLGPSVLRTTTAAAVALGSLGVLTPRWRI
jgi:16S rRNA (uracil1498-N3)-methyltransferase